MNRHRISFIVLNLFIVSFLWTVSCSTPGDKKAKTGVREKEAQRLKTWSVKHCSDVGTGSYRSSFRNGKVMLQGTCRKGKKTGTWILWFTSGQKRELREWRKGRWHGKHISWFRNGKKASQCKYKDGLPEGVCRHWFENGSMRSKGSWKRGLPHGTWIRWNIDGKEIVRKVYRKGRLKKTKKIN